MAFWNKPISKWQPKDWFAPAAVYSEAKKYLSPKQEQKEMTPQESWAWEQLQKVVEQGGYGLTPEQVSGRYQQMYQQLLPMFKGQQESYRQDAARRGVWNSGVALAGEAELGTQQSKQMANLYQNLLQWNEEAKLNSLMQALGMASGQAYNYGNVQRQMQAQNQQAGMDFMQSLLMFAATFAA